MLDAKEKHAEAVHIGHIALGLIAGDGVGSQALRTLSAAERFQRLSEAASQPEVPATRDPMTYSSQAKKLFEQARTLSEEGHTGMVGTGHVLVALVRCHRDALGLTDDDVASDAVLNAVNHARAVAAEQLQ